MYPNCNAGPPYQTFALARQGRGTYTLPGHIWRSVSDVTWLKQPQLGPTEAESKRSRSPPWRKLTLWKLKAKEAQRSGGAKKPGVLETGQQTQTRQNAHAAQIPEGSG
nr:unnamed protein product [Rangifer tarandus platyrhynchus]